jgi:hypothetical protein
MDFKEFVKPELLILVPICYALGLWIKQIDGIKNWLIPFILSAVSIVCCFLYLLASEFSAIGNLVAAYIFTALTQGILCAAAAVFAANIVRQVTIARSEDNIGTHAE